MLSTQRTNIERWFQDPSVKLTTAIILLLTVVPVAYLYTLNAFRPPHSSVFVEGWRDNTFDTSNGTWIAYASLNSSNLNESVILTSQAGVLGIHKNGTLPIMEIATARRTQGLSTLNLSLYPYMSITVMAQSIKIAARVTIWTCTFHIIPVLLTTYKDALWHTEIIDLRAFGITSQEVCALELGFISTVSLPQSSVDLYYRELAFVKIAQT